MDGDREEQRRIREVQIWDSGALQRTRYEMMLAHANAGPARMRRDLFIKEAVAHLGDKKVLEIGSQGWGAVLYKFPRLGIFYRTVTIYGCRLAEDYRS